MVEQKAQRVVTPEDVLAVMEPGITYFTGDIAGLLGLPPMKVVEVLKKMKARGLFEARRAQGRATYQIAPPRELAGPRYMAPIKPLTGYDLGALMRLCNAGRKAETGMA